jgi:hypothetical protein
MELVLEIVSEPWTPPPFNLFIDLWVIVGRPVGLQRWLARELPTINNEETSADIRRWERAKAAMEHVRKVILKDLNDNRPLAVSGAGERGADHDAVATF